MKSIPELSNMQVAGADGCKAGWVVAIRDAAVASACRMATFPTFAALAEALPETIIAIDMPIGLPDRVGRGGREPEIHLRPLLGPRQSSVFSMPSRTAVFAETYEACCRMAQETSDPPRRVSKQAFHLFPRVREIDVLLRADGGLASRVFECHPEGAFRFMKGEPLAEPKKVKSQVHPAGMAERRALLLSEDYSAALLDGPLPRGVGRDDYFDAIAASWSAARIARGEAVCFPGIPRRDRYGIEIAIRA